MQKALSIGSLAPAKTKTDAAIMNSKTFVGIDFGTSTTVVSYVTLDANNHIQCHTLPLTTKFPDGREETNDLIPTMVASKNGKICFGPAAADYKHELTQGIDLWKSFKMELGEDKGDVYSQSVFGKDSKHPILNPKDAAQQFFKYLKTRITAAVKANGLSEQIEYVISIPASFEANQRKDLLDVLNENDINADHASLIDEPNAAFLSYVFESTRDHNEITIAENTTKKVLVFDYGAGTCDISILELSVTNEGFKSDNLAISKFNKCGGDDIDRFIAEKYLYPMLRAENENVFRGRSLRTRTEEDIYKKLMNAAEALKIQVCDNVSLHMTNNELPMLSNSADIVSFHTPVRFEVMGKEVTLEKPEISYSQFNEAMKVFLCRDSKAVAQSNDDYNSIFKNVISALRKAGLCKADIDCVLLIGGSSKNPYLQFALRNYFDESEFLVPHNLQSHVSQGAAIHSFFYHGFGHSLITPITSEDILVLLKNNVESVIVKAGTPVPTSKITVEGFEVSYDGQKRIEIPICVGNKDKMLENFIINCPDQQSGYKKGDDVKFEVVITPDKVLQGNVWVNSKRFNLSVVNPFANRELTTVERRVLELQKQINNERTEKGKPTLETMKNLLKVYKDAEMYFEEAEFSEEINEQYPNTISENNIAVAYGNAGHGDKEKAILKEALKKHPNDAAMCFNYAIHIKDENKEEYCDLMEKIVDTDNPDPAFLFEYGRWLDKHGDSDRGMVMIQNALKKWEGRFSNKKMNSWDYGWMASALEYIGNTKKAKEVRNSKPTTAETFYDKDKLLTSKQ